MSDRLLLQSPLPTWQPGQIEALAKSTEQFPVDFDDAWAWVGYSRKDAAKGALILNFIEGVDFSIMIGESSGGRPPERIFLSTDCFKQFCMMAGTEQRKAVRKNFIQCERELKAVKSQPVAHTQPSPQLNGDPFIQMIEPDLEQAGVALPFIKG